MPTVLQVTPALNAGGVERTTIEIAQALTRAGWRSLVASAGGRLEAELADAGGELVRMPLETKTPWGLWRNAVALRDLMIRERASIVHARSRAPAWSALYAARALRIPFVTTYHGVYNARSGLKRLYNSVMARGDVVIANSEYTRAHVLKEHRLEPARVISIPRGVDLARFDRHAIDRARLDAARQALGVAAGARELLFLLPARLTAWKGQRVAIAAAAALAMQNRHGWRLLLAGDAQGRTAYLEELQRLIGERQLDAHVRIVGHLSDMPAAFAVCDVALFPSIEPEAFGRGAVEAQAMELPVIASAQGGFVETVREGETGVLTPPGDVAALSIAMQRMIEMGADARARMGAQGKEHVAAKYSTLALQEATLAVYRRLVEKERQ